MTKSIEDKQHMYSLCFCCVSSPFRKQPPCHSANSSGHSSAWIGCNNCRIFGAAAPCGEADFGNTAHWGITVGVVASGEFFKDGEQLRNNGLVNVTGNNNINSRLRSKESSPDPINGGAVVNNNGAGISLEKRIRDSIVLLTQNKYSVLDDGQQREAAAKLARLANMETELRVQSQGVQALGVLVNYMVHDVSIRSAFLLIFI